MDYIPPYTIKDKTVSLVSDMSELIAHITIADNIIDKQLGKERHL